DVFKIRIGILMSLTALAGYAVTPGLALPSSHILILALITLLASASAGAFNQFMERDVDARMMRTRSRPFVTGHFHHNKYWLCGILLLLLVSVIAGFFL